MARPARCYCSLGENMKSKIVLSIGLICTVTFLFAKDMPYKKNQRFSNMQIEKQIEEAFRGNEMAASTLAEFYGVEMHDTNNDSFWFAIEFDNCPEIGGYNMAIISSMAGKDNDRVLYMYFIAESFITELWKDNKYSESIKSEYKKMHADFPDFNFASDLNYSKQLLSESDIEIYKNGANRGSGIAALRLAEYYAKIKIVPDDIKCLLDCGVPGNNFDDENTALYWYRIGAQNGNEECMNEYATLLEKSKDKHDRMRSKYWRNRSLVTQ